MKSLQFFALLSFFFVKIFAAESMVEVIDLSSLYQRLQMQPDTNIYNYLANELSQIERKLLITHLLYHYQYLIIDNMDKNPLLWATTEFNFLYKEGVLRQHILAIQHSRSFEDEDIYNMHKQIVQTFYKKYGNSEAVEDLYTVLRNCPKYYELIKKNMQKKGLSNFAEFVGQKKAEELIIYLNNLLREAHVQEIPESFISKLCAIVDLQKYLLSLNANYIAR